MLCFTAILKKFGTQGEKTGWTYLVLEEAQAQELSPGTKVSFRVSGSIDQHPIERLAVLPMGDGSFIVPLNAGLRKAIGKGKGDKVDVKIALDKTPLPLDPDFVACLQDDPLAYATFESLAKGHQNYFSNWIRSAKTETTKAKRIAMALSALAKGMGYPEMMRAHKAAKSRFGT